LLKPSVPEQGTEAAIDCCHICDSLGLALQRVPAIALMRSQLLNKLLFASSNGDPLPVMEVDRDPILARRRTGKSLRLIIHDGDSQIAIMRFWWPRSARISVEIALDLFEIDSPVWSTITAAGTKNSGPSNVGVYYRETIRRRKDAASARLKKSTFNSN
jgi:hypothetical protein